MVVASRRRHLRIRQAALLQELIRLDTSNPPGREGQIDDLLASKLRPLGFDIIIVPTPEAGSRTSSPG